MPTTTGRTQRARASTDQTQVHAVDHAHDHAQVAKRAFESCRAREVMALVGDKWTMAVVYLLGSHGTQRFGDLKRNLGAISQRMLTVTLRNLERDGLVTRRIFPEIPPRVEYTLTPLGATLRELVIPLIRWSDAKLDEIDAARAQFDAAASARVSSASAD